MPSIDVTELFEDPDLASAITVTSFKQIVNEHGRAINVPTVSKIVGVIQPARPTVLSQLPDLTRVAGAVEVWCRFPLTEGTQKRAADEITWLGQQYMVASAQNWANEAGGSWTHAVCEQKALVDSDEDIQQ